MKSQGTLVICYIRCHNRTFFCNCSHVLILGTCQVYCIKCIWYLFYSLELCFYLLYPLILCFYLLYLLVLLWLVTRWYFCDWLHQTPQGTEEAPSLAASDVGGAAWENPSFILGTVCLYSYAVLVYLHACVLAYLLLVSSFWEPFACTLMLIYLCTCYLCLHSGNRLLLLASDH